MSTDSHTPFSHDSDPERARSNILAASMKTGGLKRPSVHVLLIVIIGLIAYSNTLHVPFIFDDTHNIAENSFVTGFTWPRDISQAKELLWYVLSNNRSVGYLSFALNYAFQGLNVTGYHIVNLAVHIINALLVYWLVVLTFKTPVFRVYSSPSKAQSTDTFLAMSPEQSSVIALLAALLFVSHPLQTQAVTYIVQRFTSLATLFCLLSLVTYVKFRMNNPEVSRETTERRAGSPLKSALWYLASVMCAILAMRTKEIAFTLPVILALYEFMFLEGKIRRRILFLIPLFLTMLIIPLTLLGAEKPLGELISDVSEKTRVQTAMSRGDYLFTEFRVIVTYLRLLVFPVDQNLDYDYPVYHSFFDLPVLLSFILLFFLIGTALFLAYRSIRRSRTDDHSLPPVRLISFGILWFFITLSVESSIIPIVDVIFEHRAYLPSVGVFIAAGTSAFIFPEKFRRRWPWLPKTMVVVLSCIVIIVAGATYARNTVWQDEVGFWQDVVKKSPEKARAYGNRGFAYYKLRNLDPAIQDCEKAVSLDPVFLQAHLNCAMAYSDVGMLDKALHHYDEVLSIRPNYSEAYYNRGIVYVQKGLLESAIKDFSSAISIDPNYVDAYINRGITYNRLGFYEVGINDLTVAINLDVSRAIAHFNRGVAFYERGNCDRAIQDYTEALRLNPNYLAAKVNRDLCLKKKGLSPE